MGCHRLADCAFFAQGHMEGLSGFADLYRRRYCEADHERCARLRLYQARGPASVPPAMRPNDHELVQQILFAATA